MGGLFILGSIFIAILVCGNFLSLPFIIILLITFSLMILGLTDDYLKLVKKNHKGVSAKSKLLWQFTISILAMAIMLHFKIIDTKL